MERHDMIKTVGDLLEHANSRPEVLDRAHRAVWRAISTYKDLPLVSLSELNDVREKNLYHNQPSRRMRFPVFQGLKGIDPVIAEIGEYFREAATDEPEARQLLAASGPHGCGKTTLVKEHFRRAMQRLSFYAIEACPYHESPLHAIPEDEREEFFERFFPFEGELCSVCEERLQALQAQEKDERKAWRFMPVAARRYRLSAGIGMLRSENKLPEVKDGKIPQEWYTIFQRANGGIFFVDLTEVPKEFQAIVGDVVTEGTIKLPDQTEVHLDIAVVNISNTPLLKEDGQDAGKLGDRIISVKFHLPLDARAELSIHHTKAGKQDDSHFIPGVEEVLSDTVVVSRLDFSQSTTLGLAPEEALVFYGGGVKFIDNNLICRTYKELREKRPLDGSRGLTVRQAGILRSKARQYTMCAGIQHALAALRDPLFYSGKDPAIQERLKQWVALDTDKQGNYTLGKMEARYRVFLKREIIRAWIGFDRFEEMKKNLLKAYLEHASLFLENKKIRDEGARQWVDVDEKMMRRVESELNVKDSDKDKRECRGSILAFYKPYKPGNEVLEDHMPLHDAIERVIMFGKPDDGAIPKDKQLSKFEEVQKALLETAEDKDKARLNLEKADRELLRHGYREKCCLVNVKSYAKRTIFS